MARAPPVEKTWESFNEIIARLIISVISLVGRNIRTSDVFAVLVQVQVLVPGTKTSYGGNPPLYLYLQYNTAYYGTSYKYLHITLSTTVEREALLQPEYKEWYCICTGACLQGYLSLWSGCPRFKYQVLLVEEASFCIYSTVHRR